MSGNYPPGVSGNEWQIAGPRTSEMHLTCGQTDITRWSVSHNRGVQLGHLITDMTRLTRMLRDLPDATSGDKRLEQLERAREIHVSNVNRLTSIYRDMEPMDLALCPFEGDAEVEYYDGEGHWTCPVCGYGHTIEPPDEAE